MENDRAVNPLDEQLQVIERGETAAWVVYPPTPVWWAWGCGLWAATFTLVVGRLDGMVQSIAQLGLVLVIGAVVAWDRRRRGTYPTGRPPRELHPAILRLGLGASVVGGVAWFAGEQIGVGWAAAIAGLGSSAVVWWYEREYAAVAARVRERLR